MSYFTRLRASIEDSSGPSRMSSSWICIKSFQPSSFRRLLLAILIMAAITISAAPP